MLRSSIWLQAVAVIALLVVAATASAQQVIQIAAAADLAPVLPPILAEFKAKTGMDAKASFASSATLATQIANGGPFDIFLSADMSFPQRVIDEGHGITSKPIPYARGTLVLWERNDGPVHPITLSALTTPAVTSIAVANPEHAPYGRAAMAALENLHLSEQLKPKLRIAENIAQTAQFVESGNAQFGMISLTSASTDKLQAEGSYIELPSASYPPILQGAVVLKGAHPVEAQKFLDFLLSKAVVDELARRGLKAPQ